VVGTDGIIACLEVNPDYTRRPDPSELPPVLDRLRGEQGCLSKVYLADHHPRTSIAAV
jgi:hypothetical protein